MPYSLPNSLSAGQRRSRLAAYWWQVGMVAILGLLAMVGLGRHIVTSAAAPATYLVQSQQSLPGSLLNLMEVLHQEALVPGASSSSTSVSSTGLLPTALRWDAVRWPAAIRIRLRLGDLRAGWPACLQLLAVSPNAP